MSARSISSSPSGTCKAAISSAILACAAWPSAEESVTSFLPHTAPRAARRAAGFASGGRDHLAPVVGPAGRARRVRQLWVAAVRAGDELRCRRLPLRPARPRVATRHLSLRYRHLSAPVLIPARRPYRASLLPAGVARPVPYYSRPSQRLARPP